MRGSAADAVAEAEPAARTVDAETSRIIAAPAEPAPGASLAEYMMKGTWRSVLDWSTMFSGMR